MGADDPQCRDADGQHGVTGGKEVQQQAGCKLEHTEADEHDALGVGDGQLDGLFDAPRVPGTIVVADDGHHTVVQAKDGHEHEALQLEIDAEHRHRRGRERHEDLVHEERHHAAHALHGNAGQAHDVDPPDGLAAGAEALEADLDVRVFLQVEEDGRARAAELADDGSHRGPRGAGQRLAAITKDEDGVQHDVDHRADELAGHAEVGAAGGGQQLLAHGLQKQAKAEHTAHPQIPDALQGNVRVTGLGVEIGFHAGKADDKKDHIAAQGQKNAVLGGRVGPLLILFTQAFGEQGVDAHARAHAHGDHDVLQRERQRNRGQGALADVGHEDRVHHVVQRLHQHGHHHGHTELDQQRIDVHGAHDVLTGRCLLIFFHVDSF